MIGYRPVKRPTMHRLGCDLRILIGTNSNIFQVSSLAQEFNKILGIHSLQILVSHDYTLF